MPPPEHAFPIRIGPPMADDSIDLREYVAVLRRRRSLVVVVTLAVVLLAGAYSFTRTPVYTGHAAVLVEPPSDSTSARPDQLVSLDTEARIVKSAPVARIAERTLQFPVTINGLLERVNVAASSPDALVLDIYFDDPSPHQAAAGANAFANAYLVYKTGLAESAAADKRTQIEARLAELESQLNALEHKISHAESGSASMEDYQAQRDTVNSQIGVLTTQLSTLYPNTNPGEILLPADVPTSPSSPKHLLNLALGLFAGLFLGVAAAFVRDRTDDRVREREELEQAVGVPVLATIPETAGLGDARWLATERQPRSPSAEAYRLLRTSVMAVARSHDAKVFAIASPMLREGKTTTTANLASALSQTDAQVLVVSADLREPALHEYFGKEAKRGLSELLRGRINLSEAMVRVGRNLRLLTSGERPARPAELLQSETMAQLVPILRERFDYVLIDCPPVLGLADTVSIAPFTDGVILVARAEQSKLGAVAHAADQLRQVGAIVVGTVLNDITITRGSVYGYGYGYGSGDEEIADDGRAEVKPKQRPEAVGPKSPPQEAVRGPAESSRPDERPAGRPDASEAPAQPAPEPTATGGPNPGGNGAVSNGERRPGGSNRSRNRNRRRSPEAGAGEQSPR
jgi:polysaccharide biosynthesis transport protein